jgi:hypothetical protein
MEPIAIPPNPFLVDGALAIPSFEEWFFLPGDWALYLLASRAPLIAEWLDVGPADYGGTLAGLLAWSLWILLAIALIAATSAVRRFDRAVTRGLVDGVAEVRRRMRMAITFARYRRGRRAAERKEPTFDGDAAILSGDEVRVLEMHAKIAPGFALSVSDVAEELHARTHEIRGTLERLQRLDLLHSTVGGLDGETAYTLTAAGRALLRMRHARPRAA